MQSLLLMGATTWLLISGAENHALASNSVHSDEHQVVKLEQVVVTATRNEKSPDEVTADVGLVTAEEINAAPANNVDDILRRLGGVDIRRPSDFGITSPLDISIRGVGGTKRTLFMVDGVPVNSAITGFVFPNMIQMPSIDRVEVVKGAFSSLYGSNAMGGVINVITKDRKSDGTEFTPMIKTGNFGLFEAGGSVSGRSGALGYALSASHREIDNHYRRDENVDYTFNRMTGAFTKSYENVTEHSEYDDQRLFAKFTYDLSDDTHLTFSGNMAETLSEMGMTSYQDDPREEDSEHRFHFLNVNARTVIADKIDFDVRLYTNYDRTDSKTEHILKNSDSTSDGGMPTGMGGMDTMQRAMPSSTMTGSGMNSESMADSDSGMGDGTMESPMSDMGGMGGMGGSTYDYLYGKRNHRGRDIGLQVKAGMAMGDRNYFTAGIDSSFVDGYWINSQEDGTVIGNAMDESIDNQAIYLQNESHLLDDLTVTLGVRYDINSESDDSFSPKIGVLYRLSDRISFRTSAGRAFRAPNLNELYTPTWMMVPGIPFESNPDLEPEVVWSYDLGARIKLTDHLNFHCTGFYSQAEDLIANPITMGVMRYTNLDEVETDGFEAGIDGNLFPWLNIYLNYTYTHSVDKDSGRLEDQPLHQGNSGIMLTHTFASDIKMTATFDLRYNGEMAYSDMMTGTAIELDDWIVADLGVRFQLFDRLGIQAAVTNLFDEEYEIHGSNLGPEQCCWVAMDYTF